MLLRSFVKRLKNIGDAPIPEGHVRCKSGITTYFFTLEKKNAVEKLLSECGLDPYLPVKRYYQPTISADKWASYSPCPISQTARQWVRKAESGYNSHDVFLATDDKILFVSIVHWPQLA